MYGTCAYSSRIILIKPQKGMFREVGIIIPDGQLLPDSVRRHQKPHQTHEKVSAAPKAPWGHSVVLLQAPNMSGHCGLIARQRLPG